MDIIIGIVFALFGLWFLYIAISHIASFLRQDCDMTQEDDERTRNEIIAFIEQSIHRGGGTPILQKQEDKWIAWLESKKAIDVLDEEEREFADNVDSYRKEIDAAYQKGYNEGVKVTLEKQG